MLKQLSNASHALFRASFSVAKALLFIGTGIALTLWVLYRPWPKFYNALPNSTRPFSVEAPVTAQAISAALVLYSRRGPGAARNLKSCLRTSFYVSQTLSYVELNDCEFNDDIEYPDRHDFADTVLTRYPILREQQERAAQLAHF